MHVALILRWCLCISPFRLPHPLISLLLFLCFSLILVLTFSFSLCHACSPSFSSFLSFSFCLSFFLSVSLFWAPRFLTRKPLALFKRRTRRDEIGGGEGTSRLDSPLFRLTLNFRYSYAILSTPALYHLPPFPARFSSPTTLYHSSFAQPSTLSPSFS